jgi:hypothetical protein
MKPLALGLAAALAIAACGGGAGTQATSAPTVAATTAAPTQQTSFLYTADLKSTEENPPITGAEAACSGTATVTINKTANTGVFEIDVKGCPADAEPTAAHIHEGAKGVNGPVKVNSGIAAGEFKLASGAGKITKNIAAIDAPIVTGITANPAGWYFNVHTKANAGGVVRGQLVEKKT